MREDSSLSRVDWLSRPVRAINIDLIAEAGLSQKYNEESSQRRIAKLVLDRGGKGWGRGPGIWPVVGLECRGCSVRNVRACI